MGGLDLTSLVVIPPNGRDDLAWTEQVYVKGSNTGFFTAYKSPGEYYDIVKFCTIDYQTSAIAGNRVLLYQFNDADFHVFFSGAFGPMVGPNKQIAGSVVAGNGSTFSTTDGASTTFCQSVMPVVLMQAGYTFNIEVLNNDTADAWEGIEMQVIHIPTGPEEIDASATAVPTPVLL